MADRAPTLQDFASLLQPELKKAQFDLDAENLADMLWLARHLPPSAPIVETEAPPTPEPETIVRDSQDLVTPPSPDPDDRPKTAPISPPPQTEKVEPEPVLGTGLPLQIPAANALRSQLDLARALRPLMRRIPSPTQMILDEEATAIRMAEQQISSPMLIPAPERWFDLAIVVEDSASLAIWEDTIAELLELVERQGAFRQIRTWRLQGEAGKAPTLKLNWQPTHAMERSYQASALNDPTGRRIIWLVSDCTSTLWEHPQFYRVLQRWGKSAPLTVVQLFPERLWTSTALAMGQPVRLDAASPGATQARLTADPIPLYPALMPDRAVPQPKNQPTLPLVTLPIVTLPIVNLEPEALKRWAKVTTGSADANIIGIAMALESLPESLQAEQSSSPEALALTPQERMEQFRANASITAQRLAGLMASVPVSLPIVHLIQQTMLPQSRQVHVAEVFMGGLMERVETPPDQPRRYQFIEEVRAKLIHTLPISKTLRVIDVLSAHISERLGLGTKSFTALLADARLTQAQRQDLQPFAEIALSTLKQLGEDYRKLAEELERNYVSPPPSAKPELGWPPMQTCKFTVVQITVEPLQRFEFETATIERVKKRSRTQLRRKKQAEWQITKFSGYGWQRVETLADGVELEMVEILGGKFLMGSPEDELDHRNSESPQHEVTLSDFFISKYPITQKQWKAVAGLPEVNRSIEPDPSRFKGTDLPVEQVTWYDVVEFCDRLSQATNQDYRLPTEAEWEYACRAGTKAPFYFGEMITTDLANYEGDYTYGDGPKGKYRRKTTIVGTFPANPFGLYDMYGNVWEWCLDYWHSSYAEKPEELKQNGNTSWLSSDEEASRLLRGGSWLYHPRACRSASRGRNRPGYRNDEIGFRVVVVRGTARTLP